MSRYTVSVSLILKTNDEKLFIQTYFFLIFYFIYLFIYFDNGFLPFCFTSSPFNTCSVLVSRKWINRELLLGRTTQ